MKPVDFAYTKARSLEDALQSLGEHPGDALLLAGGQSLIATLNMRLSAPDLLIDIGDLDELRGIEQIDGSIRIGAGTRHVELQRSPVIAEHAPLIAEAIEHVAHAAIRNRGTMGGNLALGDPASELPACCMALDATIEVCSAAGTRRIAAREFFIDVYETALSAGEILTGVSVPIATPRTRYAFREFVRRKGDFALAGLAIQGELDDGRFETLAPVFFGISTKPILAGESIAPLIGEPVSDDRIRAVVDGLRDELDIVGSVHASAAFKRHLVGYFLAETLKYMYEHAGS